MPELAVEEVPTPGGLEALRREWLELWERSPAATPFQSPAWLVPWWRRFGDGGEPLTLAVRREGRLVGLAPFYVRREPGGRKLLPQGIGVSDYLDPLLDPDHEREAAAAVLAGLGRRAGRFDWCDLEGLRAGSALLEAAPPEGWTGRVGEREPSPVLSLEGELGAAARSRLARLAYYARRAERLGGAALETASAANLGGLLDALFELHGARWAARGGPGVLDDPAVRAFHREAAPGLLEAGLLRLHGLRVGGRLVAVFHGLADRSRAYAYIGGFDPGTPHPGLGAMMIGHAVRRAIEEAKREFDFLRGREPYKYAWGAVDRPAFGRRLTPARSGA